MRPPDKFFKIVARDSGNPELPDVLAFVYPHDATLSSSSLNVDHTPFLTSVDDIEAQTGLDFFTVIPVEFQEQFEAVVATELWPLEAVFFAPAPSPVEEAPAVVRPREPRRAVVGRPSPGRPVPCQPGHRRLFFRWRCR